MNKNKRLSYIVSTLLAHAHYIPIKKANRWGNRINHHGILPIGHKTHGDLFTSLVATNMFFSPLGSISCFSLVFVSVFDCKCVYLNLLWWLWCIGQCHPDLGYLQPR